MTTQPNGHDSSPATREELIRVHQRIDEHQAELFGKGEYPGLRSEVKALRAAVERATGKASRWLAVIALTLLAMALKSYGVVP